MSSRRIVDLRGKRPGAPPKDATPLPLRQERRISPVRARRRRQRLILALVVILALALVAAGVSYVSYLPRFTIQSITVEGASAVPPDLIQSYADSIIYDGSHGFLARADIFLFPEALIEKDIPLEFPRISSAAVSRASILSNAITIQVVERQPAALWCDGQGNCYDMDQNGFIFAEASSTATSGQYVFEGGFFSQADAATSSAATSTPGEIASSTPPNPPASAQANPQGDPIGQTFAPGHLPGLLVFLQLLGQAGFSPTGATVEDDEDFTVPLQEGFSIYASFGEDAETLVQNLGLVLSSDALSGQEGNLEYVDLRFGDKVYYKLNGQGEVQASAQ